MDVSFAISTIYNGVSTVLLISLPIVGVGLLVGFIISVFQAVTQIQEQTLTFVPKMVAVLLMIAFTSPWIVSVITDFTVSLWANIPLLAR